MDAVYAAMEAGQWLTLDEVMERSRAYLDRLYPDGNNGQSATGTAARIRALRQPRYGSHCVESRKRRGNVWEYRLVLKS
jgi:hypothetical protein